MKVSTNWRVWLAFGHDVVAAALAWIGLYWLRYNLELHEPQLSDMLQTLAWVLPLQAGIFLAFGLYRGLWRFASLPDLQRIVLAVGLGAVAVPVVLVMLRLTSVVPRSVLILYPPVLIMLMAGSRFTYRVWKEHRLYSPLAALGEPVLILGAGEAGAHLAKEFTHSRKWRIVGLLDDNPAKQGRLLRNISVLGPIAELPLWAKRFGVHTVILALPSAAHGVRRRVAEVCAAAGVEALTVPSYDDLISGRSQLTTIRHVELDDLLGRDPVVLDSAGLGDWLGGRVVMVTGAGGSLSEFGLYQIQQALLDDFPGLPLATLVGDVKHVALIDQVLASERPSVLFHAAAYKHVPLMEERNAWQAVRNNAWGTWVLARAAVAARVEKFVLVSTDKAVNPTNVMGASKRMAEMVCQSLQNGTTQFVIVRFGNVFGSTGSVIPRFREQIARGGPVTVTHPSITRYFMSLSEATQLLLQAGLMGKGGEVLLLDMGDPVRIIDLARDMIRLSGADPDRIRIAFTGLRPGEKLFEEPLATGEATLPTPHPKLRIAQARPGNRDAVDQMIAWLERDRAAGESEVRVWLKNWIPEYVPPGASVPIAEPIAAMPPAAPAPAVALFARRSR
ncbi:MAG: polysaccharide biosynthesis protein [Betaproteobacteria bacterium 13_1_20CM_3_63_8]|nr:MAG: polysaccharide biosynthesis protein [Betaproteobacteria bacterium 13_1_20CM_3_63_8]